MTLFLQITLLLLCLLSVVFHRRLLPVLVRIKKEVLVRRNTKKLHSLLALIVIVIVLPASLFAKSPFKDLPKSHWSYPYVMKSVDAGILQGHDGKFDGNNKLDRFQTAVVTARLLKKKGQPLKKSQLMNELRARDSLFETFEEELEVLQHRVKTLDNEYLEIARMKDKATPKAKRENPFSGFGSFGLVKTDDQQNGVPLTRFAEADTMFFTVPQVSLGLDKHIDEETYFHVQFDFGSELNGQAGVTINEAYFEFEELLKHTNGRAGYFALPFSTEHRGPFRTTRLTITPSWINTLNEAWRVYGLSIEGDYPRKDVVWTLGGGSGAETNTLIDTPGRLALFNEQPGGGANVERDDSYCYYAMFSREVTDDGRFGYQAGYFDNNGKPNQVGTPTSMDVSFWQLSFETLYKDFRVMGHLLDGDWQLIGNPTGDGFKSWNILVNYEINEENSATIRFDDWEFGRGGAGRSGNAFTFAFNHQINDNCLLQFEYLTPRAEEDAANPDADDDVIQIRYKVHF